jgi:hypothetical protein
MKSASFLKLLQSVSLSYTLQLKKASMYVMLQSYIEIERPENTYLTRMTTPDPFRYSGGIMCYGLPHSVWQSHDSA